MGAPSPDLEPTLRGNTEGQRVFGRYVLKRILGRGGMGIVWQAHDETLAEIIALKFLPDAVRWDPGAFDDLKAETRRARQLTHPNIIRVHDFVEDASGAAISMEWVEGRTLTEVRLANPAKILEPAEIMRWLPQLCAALDYAHLEARLVHRDLKPTNVMLTAAGTVKVGDFGIARSLADSITRVSMMSAGTLVYMSPQQAMGEEPCAADDIYALGATLYELLAGKPPFHTGDVRVQLFQRRPDSINTRRRSVDPAAPELPAHWDETIAACLAKDAGERPATAGEVLRRLRDGVSPAARPRQILRLVRGTRRIRLLATAIVLLGSVALVGLGPRLWDGLATMLHSSPRDAFPSDATRALVAWNLDGDARDDSGRGLHGTANGVIPTQDRYGRIDRALHFNGNADITIPDSPVLHWGGSDKFTASIWLRAGRAGLDIDIWRSTPNAVSALLWSIGLAHGVPMATVSRTETDQLSYVMAAAPLTPNQWHHLAMVGDGDSLALFVNGALAGRTPLGPNRRARVPARVDVRIARPVRFNTAAFFGDLDEARLWRRALSAAEIDALAHAEAPPRFTATSGNYSDKDDLPAVIRSEFGPTARLADWEELRKWHGDDVRGWAEEAGLDLGATMRWIQRAGERRFDAQRHYFVTRFDGVKPDYFMSHDEIGGMTLSLGSWYGNASRAFVVLPSSAPEVETLPVEMGGRAARTWTEPPAGSALQMTWRTTLAPTDTEPIVASIVSRAERVVRLACQPARETLALTMGDAVRPQRERHVPASYGEVEFTMVIRNYQVRFRAISATGGTLLFDETVAVEHLGLREIRTVEVSVPPWRGAEAGLAGPTLIRE